MAADTGTAATPDWQAPAAPGPVRATVTLPGSKSITNRALILAALADGPSLITRPLAARDTALMRAAITALGAAVTGTTGPGGEPAWQVRPGWRSGPASVQAGNAGTVLRFVPPAAALARGDTAFTGDPRASARPVGPLLDGLRQAGVTVADDGRGAVPFTIRGTGAVRGGPVTLDASLSSQLVSGLMLAAPRYDAGLDIRHDGGRVPSAPHIAMTAAMLTAAGAEVTTGTRDGDDVPTSWQVAPGKLAGGTIAVEPDLSNAGPFLAAVLVAGGELTIEGWPAVSLQPAMRILELLTAMGADCHLDEAGLHVAGTGQVRGITASVADASEVAPVLAALAALADSPSQLTGIGHMRFHETDRLAALAEEIGALGGQVEVLPDGLAITPAPLRAGERPFDPRDDHRMVMAAAVLGLAVPGLRVSGAETVGKTFPDFRDRWALLLGLA